MKKYLIRFLKCLLVIIGAPIWYITAIICALFICTVAATTLFIIFYEKTGNTDVSWNKTNDICNAICNFMFLDVSDKIKEFLNN